MVVTCKGMNLTEDKGLIFVKKIDSSSVLGRDGRIRVGDRIVSINGKTLEGLPISKVRYVLVLYFVVLLATLIVSSLVYCYCATLIVSSLLLHVHVLSVVSV